MVRLKNPVLSLDARGSLGDAISFAKRRSQNIAEKKPELPYFMTLPVQYQRWLYQDYAYRWTQQTLATKRTYQSAGVRYHLTGFQYWMKYMLTNLPDIAAYWKLDYNSSPIVYDSSRNLNHGVRIGTTPQTGLIDGALFFDGVNDRLTFGNPASLNDIPVFTYLFFIYFHTVRNFENVLDKTRRNIQINLASRLAFIIFAAAVNGDATAVAYPFLNNWVAVAVTFDNYASRMPYLYFDGVESAYIAHVAAQGLLTSDAPNSLSIGSSPVPAFFTHATIDHFIIYTRVLDLTEINIHAGRRWPPR